MCTFLDPGKILLCRILEQYLSEVVSKQIMRGQFLVGQGRGSHIKLRDLGLYPGTRTLSAAGGLAGWGCRMAHWGGPGLEYDAGWASGAAVGPP